MPLKLVGETFDPADFKAHLQETLEIGKDFFIEFVFRDTCTLNGTMKDRMAQACNMVRETSEKYCG